MKIVEQSVLYKLKAYTLNPNHPDWCGKGKWFKEALGFTSANAIELAKQISFDHKNAIPQKFNEYGQIYLQYVFLRGANGRLISGVRTYWLKEQDTGLIRFINILPSKLKVLKK